MNAWIRAFLLIIIVIAAIKVSAYATTGLWQLGFTIQSKSMEPNMNSGDLISIQSSQKANIITYEVGKKFDYKSLNDYGDIIAFKPKGIPNTAPIIHRVMYYVKEGENMWLGGPPAPYAGYITKGDNAATNPSYDQQGGISYNQPVKKEWIIGMARARIPYLGYLLSGISGTALVWVMIYMIIVGYLLRKNKYIS